MARFFRRLLCLVVIILAALVLLQAVAVEAFHIPSGSMAPALLGHHRVCVCPSCNQEVIVGRHAEDTSGDARFYRKAFCPHCGHFPLPVTESAEVPGDRILVDKTAFLRRSPSRFEIIVFRLLGSLYIKRLLGLPGEEIRLHAGDLHVNGRLYRKTLDEARRMRVLVFETKGSGVVVLSGENATSRFAHQHPKCEPFRDEQAYNGGLHADRECVHDFLIETEIEALAGRGTVSLRLCDGRDWVEVLVPVGQARGIEAFTWPMKDVSQTRKLAESEPRAGVASGERRRIEMAFVDRRLSFAIDGKLLLQADLPDVTERDGVMRPMDVRADGVEVRLHQFRLYRDVHYGQQGQNAVRGKAVHLGPDQYFMLGDNSPNSEDSRFWPDEGRVARTDLIGPVMRSQGARKR